MADFWIIEYSAKSNEDESGKRGKSVHLQHIAIDVDSIVTIEKTNYDDAHTFSVDTGWSYMGKILKKVTEDEVMAEMEKLPLKR